MTVLHGEAMADFFTEWGLILWKGHGTEDAFEAHEWMIGRRNTALKHVVTVLALHNDGIAAICSFARLSKATQKFCECNFHGYQII
jgi:hypothetical protein